MLFGDLQCSSQVGSVTRFKNFSLLCPNEREARVALQDKDTGLELLIQELIAITACERLVMKLGADGFIAYDRNESGELKSQPFPALCANPLDVTGAGDSLLAVMATGLASGQAMMPTAALACCMAALAVETMGNTPISLNALQASIGEVYKA
jgi:sugar/nucleoside kinase (ribokinase family)